jgi:DNA adenine methylase
MPPDRPAFVNDASRDLIDFYRLVAAADGELHAHLGAIERWWQALADHVGRTATPLVRAHLAAEDADAGARRHLDASAAQLRACVPALLAALGDRFVADAMVLVPRKLARMRVVERQRGAPLPEPDVWRNLEGAFKAAAYTTLRAAYNAAPRTGEQGTGRHAARFFFLREYAYAAMFRFNGRGEFNVPYGGLTYNRKDLAAKIERLRSAPVLARLATTTFGCEDFAAFLARHQPGPEDFVFLDPPYDSDFSDYDGRGFGRADHERLAALMHDLPCRFQLVIKSTPTVQALYATNGWHVQSFAKTYPWTIKQRNDRRATHLLITNAPVAA